MFCYTVTYKILSLITIKMPKTCCLLCKNTILLYIFQYIRYLLLLVINFAFYICLFLTKYSLPKTL
jgi:hypothetical protein